MTREQMLRLRKRLGLALQSLLVLMVEVRAFALLLGRGQDHSGSWGIRWIVAMTQRFLVSDDSLTREALKGERAGLRLTTGR